LKKRHCWFVGKKSNVSKIYKAAKYLNQTGVVTRIACWYVIFIFHVILLCFI